MEKDLPIQGNGGRNSVGEDEADDLLNVSLGSIGSKRGRPAIQDQWTRVLHTEYGQSKATTYVVEAELQLEVNMPIVSRQDRSKDWSMYFNPTLYWEDHPGMTIENQTLP
jgi:hypothetical protein